VIVALLRRSLRSEVECFAMLRDAQLF
jgi:hypothetical protein